MEKPNLKEMLNALMHLRTAKGRIDVSVLDKALVEAKKNQLEVMLRRILIHTGDISRQHNILREFGIKSSTGGAQERETFRAIIRWWKEKMPESFKENIRNIVEFSVYENIMFYQNTTDRYKGKLVKQEIFMHDDDFIFEFLGDRIRKGDEKLVARHLPKYETGRRRVAKLRMKRTGFYKVPKNKEWVKYNGIPVIKGTEKIAVNEGDIISFPRDKQEFTIEKQRIINSWISKFCDHMGWTIAQYKQFRSKQGTAEQVFSTQSVKSMPKSEFMSFLNGLTAGQRYRVAKMITNKTGNVLTPVTKWGSLGNYYIEWENQQERIADELRKVASTGDETKKAQLMKQFKVKATGLQTVDLLAELFSNNQTEQQINNTYQALIEKMDLIANVFVIVDGSGSMSSSIYYDNPALGDKYRNISRFSVASTLAITFSTRNPNLEFRNTFGWFSRDFHIIGKSKYINTAPNQYLMSPSYRKNVTSYDVLSETNTFSKNFSNFRSANPGEVSCTNMFASIEYFVNLVKEKKIHVEDLPVALLYITDGEVNTGKSLKEAMELAWSIGWYPLAIFWGLYRLPEYFEKECNKVNNVLPINGFSESTLSQILRGIKSGSINPQDQLWSIHEDKRYSIVK